MDVPVIQVAPALLGCYLTYCTANINFVQVQGFEMARRHFGQVVQYDGMIHCMSTIHQKEGFLAFYKGGVPAVIKVREL